MQSSDELTHLVTTESAAEMLSIEAQDAWMRLPSPFVVSGGLLHKFHVRTGLRNFPIELEDLKSMYLNINCQSRITFFSPNVGRLGRLDQRRWPGIHGLDLFKVVTLDG